MLPYMRTYLISFVLFFCITSSHGKLQGQKNIQESYAINYLDVSDGLASNYVSSIVSDYRGIKWLATEGGLNAYDGKNFKLYTPRTAGDGLRSENIETLCPARDGKIWVATKNGGISKYDPKLDEFTNYNAALGGLMNGKFRPLTIAEDRKGRLWVGTAASGVIVISPEDNKVVIRRHHRSQISGLSSDRHGNIWYCNQKEVTYYNTSEDSYVVFETSHYSTQLVEDTLNQRIWVAGGRNLAYIDLKTHKVKELWKVNEIPVGFYIQSLQLDQQGRLWIGTWGGGLFVRKTTGQIEEIPLSRQYDGPRSVNHRSVIDIHIDEQGLVWLATALGGVVKLSPRRGFAFLGNQPHRTTGLQDNNIRKLAVTKDTTLLLGTNGGGLHRWVPGQSPELIEEYSLSKIKAIILTENRPVVAGREGTQYLDTQGKIGSFDNGNFYIAALHQDAKGGLWLGSQIKGLAYLPSGDDYDTEIDFSAFSDKLISPRISCFAEDDKHLWIGTYGGVHLYDLETGELKPPAEIGKIELLSPICHNLLVLNQELWVASPAGLVRLTIAGTEQLLHSETYTSAQGLPDDFVAAINVDEKGFIWGSTSRGLFRLDPQNGYILTFGTSDGITVGAFNIGATARDSSGVLYFGGTNGLVYFDPAEISTQRPPPGLELMSLDINGKQVKVGEIVEGKVPLPRIVSDLDELDLSYKYASFSLAYAATDYLGTETVTSQYRLRGLNEQWIEVPDFGNLAFTGLRTGNYQLELRGSRDRLNWSAPLKLTLNIPPPPWRSTLAYILYTLLLGFTIFAVRRNAVRQQELTSRTELAELSELKERELTQSKLKFFTNISHELRTPLTLILSPLTDLLGDQKLRPNTHSVITGIHRNASRLLNLVNQLLDFRKAESGQLVLKTAKGNFEAFAREIHRSFQPLADSRSIDYSFDSEGDFTDFYYDRDKLEIVICNLLSNAFKFCNKEVFFALRSESGGLVFTVNDDGPGVPEDNREKVFDRFVQLHHDDESLPISSGIGLAFSKHIVELHHGDISLTDRPQGGASFEVRLPAGRAHLTDKEVMADFRGHDDRQHYVNLPTPVKAKEAADKLPTLLLVDDNPEILSYLLNQLNGLYRVLTASDGIEALQIAGQQPPDIVVSDVMMPNMDGIELCKQLKSNVGTSHIPVLLLTARTSTVYQVNSLQIGADDYVTKPFSSDVLRARIQSLLNNREKLRKYYLNQLRFEPGKLKSGPDPEEKFLSDLIALIEKSLGEENISGDFLAQELFMSRSTLFRKIKALTGLSISAFVRGVRLRRAAERLLSEPQTPISQIAFDVGFMDSKYFRKCFRQEFDSLPSTYRTERRQKNTSPG